MTIRDLDTDVGQLADLAALFVRVWGTGPAGPPISTDLLRSFTHAGAAVTAAYDATGEICGGAVAIRSGPDSLYSLIAGVRPGESDRGTGSALKHHQRRWALARGFTSISWTFDPLVARNARFNLVKLGATAGEYSVNFYGPMTDAINAGDESDRLTARWQLDSPTAEACSRGEFAEVVLPAREPDRTGPPGPDGEPLTRVHQQQIWVRMPRDILGIRAADPGLAAAWRRDVRAALGAAFADGYVATGVSRDSWYRLERPGRT
ncbi:GNAT family N-acetyltransferase [Nakamurella silvestris]|nr:GNAT family N-acetyltransferase [Nakamurella silvestris]